MVVEASRMRISLNLLVTDFWWMAASIQTSCAKESYRDYYSLEAEEKQLL